jgi:hypothetical protein
MPSSEGQESSLVVEVTFGDHHDEALERERRRTREVVESLSDLGNAGGDPGKP